MVFFLISMLPNSEPSLVQIESGRITQTFPELANPSKTFPELAQTQVAQPEAAPELEPAEQVWTDLQDLSGIGPSHWAWEAVRALTDKYQCFPDLPQPNTPGQQSLSRDHFAQVVNQCLDSMTHQSFEQIDPQDWVLLQRLQSDFEREIDSLNQRLDLLDPQLSNISQTQFSPTTRLTGDVVFSLEQLGGESRPSSDLGNLPDNLAVGSRLRLNLDTSFTGKDLLKVRLDALNPVAFNGKMTGSNMTRLNFDRNNQNSFDLGKLFYRFPVSQKVKVQVDAVKGSFYANSLNTFSGSLANPVNGSISRFGRFNPIYYQGFPGSGVTATYQPNHALTVSLGYLAKESDASQGSVGLFNGSNTVMTQLDYQVKPGFQLGLTYAHSNYTAGSVAVAGGTGSQLANAPFGNLKTSAHHVGLESSVRLSPRANLSGWAGVSFAEAQATGGAVESGDQATVLNWAIALGLPDLGGQGHFGGLILGQPPHTLSHSGPSQDEDAALHLEALYRYQVNSRISITPGIFVVFHPENQVNNDPIWVGSLRTTLRF